MKTELNRYLLDCYNNIMPSEWLVLCGTIVWGSCVNFIGMPWIFSWVHGNWNVFNFLLAGLD